MIGSTVLCALLVTCQGLTKESSEIKPVGPQAGLFEYSSSDLNLVQVKDGAKATKTRVMGNGVKLLWGVFNTTQSETLEMVIGNTWARQEGVCLLKDGNKLDHKHLQAQLLVDCHVTVAFVNGGGRESHFESTGHIVLRTDDSKWGRFPRLALLQGGETSHTPDAGRVQFEYFKFASKAFPQFTHLVQMDVNTYPDVYNWHQTIRKLASSKKGCENFITGPIQAMSRRLALGVSRTGGAWDRSLQLVQQGATDGLTQAINDAKDSVCINHHKL